MKHPEARDLLKARPSDKVDPLTMPEAIGLTLRTIEERTRRFRDLVIGVVIVGSGSMVMAVMFWTAWWLLAVALIFPLVVLFLWLDRRCTETWRKKIKAFEKSPGFDSALFLRTISQMRHVPPNTLKAMLALLADHPVPAPPASPSGAGRPTA